MLQRSIDAVSTVVDLAATTAPLHIGPPVALIKALLGIVVFQSKQMETLRSGVRLAVYMLLQLSLYFEYFKQVEPPAAQNLEDVLASPCSHVFAFLAIGHRTSILFHLRLSRLRTGVKSR